MGYTKTFEATFIRVKHKIDFRVGMRAIDLMNCLKAVPPETTVDEVIDDTGDGKTSTIEFHEGWLMSKPICKSEAKWKFWREERPIYRLDKFSKFAKKQMVKARRRFLKIITLS